jgi:Protein of unknown function (DUF1812).
MIILKKNIFRLLFCSVIGAAVYSSCVKGDVVVPPKGVDVLFNYSYNMLNSNAFGEKADRVLLYVFNQDSLLVTQESVEGTVVTNDLRIPLPHIADGKFFFAAFAHSTYIQSSFADFKVPDMTIGESKLADLKARLNLPDNRVQNYELNDFLIGYSSAIIANTSSQSVTLNMKKVNRKIRIVLLPMRAGAEPLDPTTFDFKIVDGLSSGEIDYKYEQLRGDGIIYKPYFQAKTAPEDGEVLPDDEINSAVIAEINTARLITTNKPKLTITDKTTRKEVVKIDLIWIISLIEMKDNAAKWSLQEYLDREDEYNISLFFDSDTATFLRTTIVINGWVINLDDIGL